MILVVIPAKGSSSRLANKNMRELNGRPMIDYVIDEARASERADSIVVSTDSDEIAEHVEGRGIQVVRRPTSLGGEVPLFDVYKHAAVEFGLDQVDILIGLQVDHPDRNVPVDAALAEFENAKADYMSSTDAEGTVNGSYKIYNRQMLETGESKHHIVLVDDCTNIHYAEDLERASERLSAK